MHPRRVEPLAQRILFHEAIEILCSYSEIVQQRIAFRRSPEAEHPLALSLRAVQKGEVARFHFFDSFAERDVRAELVAVTRPLRREQCVQSPRRFLDACVRSKANDRTPMNRR